MMRENSMTLPSVSVFCNLVQGGAEKQAVETAKILHAKGHEVKFYCYNLKKAFYHPENEINVIDIKNYQFQGPEVIDKVISILRLARLINRDKPDIFISYTTLLNVLNGMISLVLGKSHPTHHIGSERNSVLRYTNSKIWRMICRISYKGLSGIFSNNSAAIKQLVELIHINHQMTFLIPNILDVNYFKRENFDSNKMHKKFSILLPARVCEQKNQKILVPVAEELVRRNFEFVFLLAGSPEKNYAEELKELIAEHHLDFAFIWLGQQSDIKKLYMSSDLTYLPSKYEGFSNSLCEALACESVVLTSNIDSFKDLVSDGANGFLVSNENYGLIAEKIYEISQLDVKTIDRIRKAARSSVLNYGPDGYYQNFIAMLNKVKS